MLIVEFIKDQFLSLLGAILKKILRVKFARGFFEQGTRVSNKTYDNLCFSTSYTVLLLFGWFVFSSKIKVLPLLLPLKSTPRHLGEFVKSFCGGGYGILWSIKNMPLYGLLRAFFCFDVLGERFSKSLIFRKLL